MKKVIDNSINYKFIKKIAHLIASLESDIKVNGRLIIPKRFYEEMVNIYLKEYGLENVNPSIKIVTTPNDPDYNSDDLGCYCFKENCIYIQNFNIKLSTIQNITEINKTFDYRKYNDKYLYKTLNTILHELTHISQIYYKPENENDEIKIYNNIHMFNRKLNEKNAVNNYNNIYQEYYCYSLMERLARFNSAHIINVLSKTYGYQEWEKISLIDMYESVLLGYYKIDNIEPEYIFLIDQEEIIFKPAPTIFFLKKLLNANDDDAVAQILPKYPSYEINESIYSMGPIHLGLLANNNDVEALIKEYKKIKK